MRVLRALLRQCAGNILPMGAIALIPIIGMAGSGLDMGRAYMAQSRLQQACDAGALAGRAQLSATNNADALALADNMFGQNFPAGKYGATDLVKQYSVDSKRAIIGTASAKMPTTLTKLFGKDFIAIATGCKAETQLPNVDIMFVLDTTGSMKDTNPGDSKPREAVMREAVLNFYDQVKGAASADAQIRMGFVPYSSNVNVGHLLKPEWLVDTASYQSRRPNGTDPNDTPRPDTEEGYDYQAVSGTATTTFTVKPPGETGGCVAPNSNATYTNDTETVISDTTDPTTGKRTIIVEHRVTQNGTVYWADSSSGQCRIYKSERKNYVEKNKIKRVYSEYVTRLWYYGLIPYSVASLKANQSGGYLTGTGSISAQIARGHKFEQTAWNGCIEERQTANVTDFTTIPANAYDLQIDLLPTSDTATRWRPAIPALVYSRWDLNNWNYAPFTSKWDHDRPNDVAANLVACPAKARKLAAIDRSDLITYLGGLTMLGGTYHDIGMIWGARLLSPDGLFKTENTYSKNNGAISRHLILMTDGQTEADVNVYGAYGYEGLDRRRTPTGKVPTADDLNSIVDKRFQAICAAARGKYTVWVIAFGTSLSKNLSDCATPGSALEARNSTELYEAFRDISGKISNLRLTE